MVEVTPTPRRRTGRRAASDSGVPANGTSQAAPAAAEPLEILAFEFTADRFGYVPSAKTSEIGYARDVLRALDRWAETIEQLCGDIDRGLRAAGEARIMPYYPTWSSTLGWRQLVQTALAAAPGTESFDQTAREALEELRIYLGMLETWCATLEAGLWLATIAARASVESDPQRRLLQGFVAVKAVCEFDASDTRERILPELRDVVAYAAQLTRQTAPEGAIFPQGIAALIGSADEALRFPDSTGSFVEEPTRLDQWAEKLRSKLVPQQQGDPLSGEQWSGIESAYWRQWDWPPAGAVARREPSGEISKKMTVKMTVLDLMMAARHDGATLLHWRGGLLSIYQWSRILSIATPERLAIMRAPTEAAFAQLNFAELVDRLPQADDGSKGASAPPPPPSKRSAALLRPPLIALSFAPDRPPPVWRPEGAARAFALIPDTRA